MGPRRPVRENTCASSTAGRQTCSSSCSLRAHGLATESEQTPQMLADIGLAPHMRCSTACGGVKLGRAGCATPCGSGRGCCSWTLVRMWAAGLAGCPTRQHSEAQGVFWPSTAADALLLPAVGCGKLRLWAGTGRNKPFLCCPGYRQHRPGRGLRRAGA
jgi:hypothetical protein